MKRRLTLFAILLLCSAGTIAADERTSPLPADRPDYSIDANWAARPDLVDPADVTPEGLADNQADAPVDVFYIHPTTYRSTETWNAEIDDSAVNAETDLVIQGQASAFNKCCAIYAPRYRQAAIAAVMDQTGAGAQAYDFAFQDVKAAFERFLVETEGRPFILAGHSQGTFHAERLISDVIIPEKLQDQLIAAYLVGIGIPTAFYDTQWSGLHACATPSDTRCVVSWNTFGPEADTSSFRIRLKARHPHLMGAAQSDSVQCTNPITWRDSDESGDASLNAGAVFPGTRDGGLSDITTGAIGAACQDGALMLSVTPSEPFASMVIGDGNYHLADYALFYKSIRNNAQDRVADFIGRP